MKVRLLEISLDLLSRRVAIGEVVSDDECPVEILQARLTAGTAELIKEASAPKPASGGSPDGTGSAEVASSAASTGDGAHGASSPASTNATPVAPAAAGARPRKAKPKRGGK